MTSACSSRSPPISTSKTSGIASIVSCKSLARFIKVLSGKSPDNVTTIIGNILELSSSTVGSSASAGKSGLTLSVFSLTSSKALSTSKPASNSKTILAPPSKAVAFISFNPETLLNSFSKGLIKSLSESSGEIPL
ncbi:MAG: hypothetical protein BWY78_00944 [Alphaproteobacteria bacterium ADurb.Bin438]|nr:MAG: hypothetical protein BWY78_00944 [Alphaproteobacteria bacterium ADurb.Bin438]